MTTKKDQPMEVGEPTTEVAVEQESSQHAEVQAQTGVPPNTEMEEIIERTTQEQLHSVEEEIPESVMVEEKKFADGASNDESTPIPIPNEETETDRKNEEGENPITDASLDAPSTGDDEGILVKESVVGDEKEKIPKKQDLVVIAETETEEKPKKKRATSRKDKAATEESVPIDSEKKEYESPIIEIKNEAKKQDPTKVKIKLPKSVEKVVSIDAERSVLTDDDKNKSDLIDLVESLKRGKVLSDTIQGIEKTIDESVAVIYHGIYKVIIPALEILNPPADYRGYEPKAVHEFMLKKRLGSEIDYIVKGIDPEIKVAVASRKDAMRSKAKEYYLSTDRDGNNILYSGICAEARVVSVIKAGIFVDLFGVETYIPLKELSYQRMVDASSRYQAGQRILVKILEIDKTNKKDIKVKASVKQVSENPYEKALKRYTVGNSYVGTVSIVDTTGVFVALDGGIDCLCAYTKRGRPPKGARVAVRILGINNEANRIWGWITHIATPR